MSHLKQAQYMFICTDWILRGEVILQGNILLSCLVFIPIAILFLSDTYFMLFNCWVMSNSLQPHRLQHARIFCPSLSPSLLKLMSIESMRSSNHLIPCFPLLCLSSIFPSIKVFSNELALHIRWPKHWSFSFSISIIPSNEYSGLISFRIDWFDLLAVQGTLKSLLQLHSSKASILQLWGFYMFFFWVWHQSHIQVSWCRL